MQPAATSVTISAMRRSNQFGNINVLLIPLILVVLLFVGSLAFGAWAYSGKQDYKNNVDPKIAAAVEIAKKENSTQKDNEFIEKEKQPLRDYKGSSAYGAPTVKYPKTWSAYVSETNTSTTPINGFFHPSYVPDATSETNFALRLQVTSRTYAQELADYDTEVKSGKLSAQPFRLAGVPSVLGTRFDGEFEANKQGIVVVLPLRDKSIKIWTEAEQYKKDFNDNILPNFVFTP